MKRLVFAPHADDETMGCGGVLAKYDDVVVCVAAAMEEQREKEFAAAMGVLGVPESHRVALGWPDGSVGEHPKELVSIFDRVVESVKPDVVYVPFPSMHQDHIAVYEAGIRACRTSMSGHWSPAAVLVYDDVAYDMQLYPTDVRWNRVEALDGAEIDAKVEAMNCYGSQLPSQEEHPALAMKDNARALGSAHGVTYGERFGVLRDVVR